MKRFSFTFVVLIASCIQALAWPESHSPRSCRVDASQVLAEWTFHNDDISMNGTTIMVKDRTGQYVGVLKDDATIRTIGSMENGQFNVLDFGEHSGYMDLGSSIGSVICGLTDYTISAYFRIDANNTSLAGSGNFIWNFSNSDDINRDMNGCMIGNLTDQSHSVARTNWQDNQNVSRNAKATKGVWHHYAFTQNGKVGTLYVDGIQVAKNNNMTYTPKEILPRSGSDGTRYNWLGRSCYAGDNCLNKTLLYDFMLLNTALSADEIAKAKETIKDLNAAYKENSDASDVDLTADAEALTLGDLSSVTEDLVLPNRGMVDKDVKIQWTSSHPNIVSPTGKLTPLPDVDAHVVLMATLTKKFDSITKDFRVHVPATNVAGRERTRVIVSTDGEEDDKASMVRFLLTSAEFDVEAIVNSSSQFHWVGGSGWNAFQPVSWVKDYIGLYSQVYDNLLLHDAYYPSPEYLTSRWHVGNINNVGGYSTRSDGARFIANILLDQTDDRPIWLQAWGGCNTFAAALKIIEDDYPERMEEVARKIRFYLIWEQDGSYQQYIRKSWEKYDIPTIIADQFDCIAYIWNKVLPDEVKPYFSADFIRPNILTDKGALCDIYTNVNGAYNAEGDSPSFLHCINNGLRNMESPGYGGWGGRYVKVRGNVWMDTPPSAVYKHPTGQYGFSNSWSKKMENWTTKNQVAIRTNYFRPLWRWIPDFQQDFAARADWCVKSYSEANHHPIARLSSMCDMNVKSGQTIVLDASESSDPDGDKLHFRWYIYPEAGTYDGTSEATSDLSTEAAFSYPIPADARLGQTIHLICEVSDDGQPTLKNYLRVILTVNELADNISPTVSKALPLTYYNLSGYPFTEPDMPGVYVARGRKVIIK